MTTTPRLFPPTAVTCPDWCTQQTGHEFDQRDDDGSEIRVHVRTHGDNVDTKPSAYSADVVQMVRWKDGREEPLEALGIQVWVAGDTVDDHITDPALARRLAAHLMDAADTLERIQGGAK